MRKYLSILLLCTVTFPAFADHITGGEMYYTYTGFSNGLYRYDVTLKLFMRCNSGRQFPDPAIISVFDKVNFKRIEDISAEILTRRTIQISNPDPCITDPPQVCYEVALYNFTVALPVNQAGYILASQVNYRINGISNLAGGSQVGATYTCEIPGTQPQGSGHINNSAAFTGSDLVIVCAGNFFSYSFAAKDPDGDQLRYSFCPAYNSSNPGINGIPAGVPPYEPVPYNGPDYGQLSPMGIRVKIDPQTGLITGVAPPGGIYVVTVCVEEVRGGTVIATQRKDLQINVADCSVAAAQLDEDYMVCGDSRTTSIKNISNSPLIVSYDWTVFSPNGNVIHQSQNNFLNYTFPSNGKYPVQLIVNKGAACTDTSTTNVFVYLGLVPAFSTAGICISNPTTFRDETTVLTGTINSWSWDFGEAAVGSDTSTKSNPVYTYLSEGTKNARLIVTTSEGCRDTLTKAIEVVDKPAIQLAFRDTLLCVNDRLQLQAGGAGAFNWSPAAGMVNATSANPIVTPATTTTYFVDINVDGCTNRDSVLVRVTDHVELMVMNDTVICNSDAVQLQVNSDGLQFEWTPVHTLNSASAKNPLATPTATTRYEVTARIGGCSTTGSILVSTVPYPAVYAGNDTTICFNSPAFLQASTNSDTWSWSSTGGLEDPDILNPVVSPTSTTAYVFTGRALQGCPKPVSDTVQVTVLPKIVPFAGNDTVIVTGQALHLSASGGDAYQWSPPHALSATNISNPVAIFHEPSEGSRYVVRVMNSIGCSDTASMMVKVFATAPAVFVPTAFTPNNDGLNDLLRPVVAGMKKFDYFQVYNRWGQLVYSTSLPGDGWDGKINGQLQTNNVYVWLVKAVDFNGNPYFRRGTVTLIR